MSLKKRTKKNFVSKTNLGPIPVYAEHHNEVIDKVNDISPSNGTLSVDSATITDGITVAAGVTQYTTLTTLTATEIVGTGEGDIGHADGAELVASPGAGYVLQFVSAVLVYQYDKAAYTGGVGDDLTVYVNSVAVSPAIATADLIQKGGDTVINLQALSSADYVLGVNSNINLASTEVTNTGGAVGVIRAYVTYNKITTGL